MVRVLVLAAGHPGLPVSTALLSPSGRGVLPASGPRIRPRPVSTDLSPQPMESLQLYKYAMTLCSTRGYENYGARVSSSEGRQDAPLSEGWGDHFSRKATGSIKLFEDPSLHSTHFFLLKVS